MRPSEVQQYFCDRIPQEYPKHMFCYFSANAAKGIVLPFVLGLVRALTRIDDACPGFANEIIDRMASIPDTGEQQYQSLIQILAEVYVAEGAAEAADRNENGHEIMTHEPGQHGQKNPEFESRSNGHWYAVEVKTPALIEHARRRTVAPFQLTARLPREATESLEKTLPRDNPVKDFLVSANSKFEQYSRHRSEAFRILTIIWDDFCNEPISALLHSESGLLTANSFHKDTLGNAVLYPFVDGVLVCRYQHQIIRATRNEPLIDQEGLPFVYHHFGFPPKAWISNPNGRTVPEELLESLNATPYSPMMGAEYVPGDLVMWCGNEQSQEEGQD